MVVASGGGRALGRGVASLRGWVSLVDVLNTWRFKKGLQYLKNRGDQETRCGGQKNGWEVKLNSLGDQNKRRSKRVGWSKEWEPCIKKRDGL